jgi:proteasome lid subunit RPN8/RPN11
MAGMNLETQGDLQKDSSFELPVLRLVISKELLNRIWRHGETAYPEEGAGLLLGSDRDGQRQVTAILPLINAREQTSRHNRYLITAQEMLQGEQAAMRLGLDIVGVFHSHPDHPNQPSEYDREWALPWYSYVITSVAQGAAQGSRSWRLKEDRSQFFEETLAIIE